MLSSGSRKRMSSCAGSWSVGSGELSSATVGFAGFMAAPGPGFQPRNPSRRAGIGAHGLGCGRELIYVRKCAISSSLRHARKGPEKRGSESRSKGIWEPDASPKSWGKIGLWSYVGKTGGKQGSEDPKAIGVQRSEASAKTGADRS